VTLRESQFFIDMIKRRDFLKKLQPSKERDKLIAMLNEHLGIGETPLTKGENEANATNENVNFRKWALFLEKTFIKSDEEFRRLKIAFEKT
jgi:hypothetical protein